MFLFLSSFRLNDKHCIYIWYTFGHLFINVIKFFYSKTDDLKSIVFMDNFAYESKEKTG